MSGGRASSAPSSNKSFDGLPSSQHPTSPVVWPILRIPAIALLPPHEKNHPRIVRYLKTSAAKREIDLHPDVADCLGHYRAGKSGLLFSTEAGTPHFYGNLDDRWLTPRLVKMGLDEKGMGWHSFKRFRKTWLRGARCLEDLNNFWMAHKPQTMSEVYSPRTRNFRCGSTRRSE
jgi:hypothetical protein